MISLKHTVVPESNVFKNKKDKGCPKETGVN
jgi:hypothetical protein